MALYFIKNDARKGLKISFLLTSPLRLEKDNAFYFKQETSILGKAWNFFSQLYLFLCIQDFLIFPPFFFPPCRHPLSSTSSCGCNFISVCAYIFIVLAISSVLSRFQLILRWCWFSKNNKFEYLRCWELWEIGAFWCFFFI